MQVNQLMTKTLATIDARATLAEAAEVMRDLDIGILPVREGGVASGVVTDRDIVIRAVADKRDPSKTQIREILTPRLHAVFEDQDIRVAAEIMASERVRRLLVLDEDQNAIGVLSLGDLARAGFREETDLAVEGVSRDGETFLQH